MGHGADQNLGPDDGRRRNDQTPSTDNSAGMADKRGALASISGLIADCVKTIASFAWANGQEKRIEAHIKGALDTCLEYHANRMLQLTELDEPVTQDAKDQLKKDLLQEAPVYREYAEAIEAAKTVASDLVHEHYYGRKITELNARIGRQLESIIEELGENGSISAAKLCEKLEPHFPPPADPFFTLTPKSLCLEVACDTELKHVYGAYIELRDNREATESAIHKELTVDQLRKTANALESILGTSLRLEYTEEERKVIKAIYEKIPWEKQEL